MLAIINTRISYIASYKFHIGTINKNMVVHIWSHMVPSNVVDSNLVYNKHHDSGNLYDSSNPHIIYSNNNIHIHTGRS